MWTNTAICWMRSNIGYTLAVVISDECSTGTSLSPYLDSSSIIIFGLIVWHLREYIDIEAHVSGVNTATQSSWVPVTTLGKIFVLDSIRLCYMKFHHNCRYFWSCFMIAIVCSVLCNFLSLASSCQCKCKCIFTNWYFATWNVMYFWILCIWRVYFALHGSVYCVLRKKCKHFCFWQPMHIEHFLASSLTSLIFSMEYIAFVVNRPRKEVYAPTIFILSLWNLTSPCVFSLCSTR